MASTLATRLRARSAARARLALASLASLALGALAGCVVFNRPPGLNVSSDPPGARVLVDQKDTGFVTPCVLELEEYKDKGARIDLVYPGYTPAVRWLSPDRQIYVMYWNEMTVSFQVWHFPLWLNTGDALVPFKDEKRLIPKRLFVRLQRDADSGEAPTIVPGLPKREPELTAR